jgi:hypothetical protein
MRGIIFLPDASWTRGKISFMPNLGNTSCLICNTHHSLFHFLNAYSMSITADTTYMASFPKRPDIMGAPDHVFKFKNFFDRLIGDIKANTISAIGTINPGSLCTQYLYAPQIHSNLASDPIAFIDQHQCHVH